MLKSSHSRSKIMEFFCTQENIETSQYGNTSFLSDKLRQWLDSIEMNNELGFKQGIFSIISCLVPFKWLVRNHFEAASIFINYENNPPLDTFFQPSHFNGILKSSFKSIKNIMSQQIRTAK